MTSSATLADALSLCDREPIRIPGSIQPHGFFLGLRADGSAVIQVSDNIGQHTGHAPDDVLGGTLADAIGPACAAQLAQAIAAHHIEARPVYLGTVSLPNHGFFDVLAHACDGMLALEFETVARGAHADFRQLYPLVGGFLAKLTDVDSIERLCDIAAREVKSLTGFARVLVYRFDEHGHGLVLAEAREPEYHSYLQQRFPASDVPRQARELYVANRIRLIADADYVPAKLVPAQNPLTGAPTDLTHASLRSVSPIHVRYLKNMGTQASMSISIVIRGKLWGLISCHHAQAKTVPFESRTACEQLAQILALRIESREDALELQSRLELRRMLVNMLAALSQGTSIIDSMAQVELELLRFGSATGAALVSEGQIARFGKTPDEAHIQDLVQWLNAHANDEVFHTDCLASVYPAGAAIAACASGILALPISRIHNHYLIWFRAEVVQVIDWAGDPHAKFDADDAAPMLSPRKSFELWRETVRGASLPWRASEIEIAGEFRAALLGIVLERAEQMAQLVEELGRANKELEAFSYSVSHDLRAPMRHIVGFADLLLEFEGAKLSERGVRFIHNIKDSARFSGKLVDDLLSFSQMGRASLRIGAVDMNELCQTAMEALAQEYAGRNVEWQLAPLPSIHADQAFLRLAIHNLFSNAIKYSRGRDPAIIAVTAEQNENEHVFHVRDNGVGFPMEYAHKLFGVFQRLHRMEEFEGTGIGLANVRRIVERHGGRVWAHGVPDQGATFSFSLPKHILVEPDQ